MKFPLEVIIDFEAAVMFPELIDLIGDIGIDPSPPQLASVFEPMGTHELTLCDHTTPHTFLNITKPLWPGPGHFVHFKQ